MARLQDRLTRLEASCGHRSDRPIYFCLADWADGAPRAFEEDQAEEAVARFEPIALDRLVAAGRINECDRERVRFIVRIVVDPDAKLVKERDSFR